MGIHPSYYSRNHQSRIRNEKEKLERIIGDKVISSRQHFLRFCLPDTYRYLLKLGIREEYSMGYANQVGYRAGTCTPFYWYDLQAEIRTEMRIYPFQVMDGSLRNYMGTEPAEAEQIVDEIIQDIRQYGGIFGLIWHNSSLGGFGHWSGWREVYQKILRNAAGSEEL